MISLSIMQNRKWLLFKIKKILLLVRKEVICGKIKNKSHKNMVYRPRINKNKNRLIIILMNRFKKMNCILITGLTKYKFLLSLKNNKSRPINLAKVNRSPRRNKIMMTLVLLVILVIFLKLLLIKKMNKVLFQIQLSNSLDKISGPLVSLIIVIL